MVTIMKDENRDFLLPATLWISPRKKPVKGKWHHYHYHYHHGHYYP